MIALLALFANFLANVIFFYVLKDSKSYVVSALIYSSPFFTVIASYFFLRERFTAVNTVACALIIVGIVLLALGDTGPRK